MEDQLFRKAGDHEAFCKSHADKPRSQNRKEVTALLRKKADGSWQEVKELVAKMEKEGGLRGIRRFWIVNGFACAAKPDAIRKLAEHKAVSFVYLDRFPRPVKPSKSMSSSQAAAMKALLEPGGNQGTRGMAQGKGFWPGRYRGGDRLGYFANAFLGLCPLEESQGNLQRRGQRRQRLGGRRLRV
jgi:hypothetical protein